MIAQLEALKEKHGDLPVYAESIDDGFNSTIFKVKHGNSLIFDLSGNEKVVTGAILETL